MWIYFLCMFLSCQNPVDLCIVTIYNISTVFDTVLRMKAGSIQKGKYIVAVECVNLAGKMDGQQSGICRNIRDKGYYWTTFHSSFMSS